MKIPKPKKIPRKRVFWQINPVTRVVEDKTKFNRARTKDRERRGDNED